MREDEPEPGHEAAAALPRGHGFIGLSRGEFATFKWLALGHLLYAIGLLATVTVVLDLTNIWLTPLFGLPLLAGGSKDRIVRKMLLFILGLPAIHYGAEWLAVQSYSCMPNPFGCRGYPVSSWIAGAVGGSTGAAASVVLCWALRLLRPGRTMLVSTLKGTVVLAVIGSLGLFLMLTADDTASGPWTMLWLYTPWQLAFAYLLAKVLRQSA